MTVVLGDGGVAAISVRDRGVGVPVEDRRRIFDKFARGAGAVASGAKGTGLGLAIVKEVADIHGGRVDVSCPEGMGCTFRLYLPAR